jgi:hypothetical protein
MRHYLRQVTFIIAVVGLCTACPMGPQGQWVAPYQSRETIVKDHVECLAIASQGAQGYGAFFSDRILREAMYNTEKEKLYTLCAQSRGYSFQAAR